MNYAEAEKKILSDAAKCVKFAAAYGASTETIAKILGVQLKGDMKMKKQKTLGEVVRGGGITEKYNVREGQMTHFVGAGVGYFHNCVFCPTPARHIFKARSNTAKIYLCTKHMVQFFHLKPNRMAPKLKTFVPTPLPEGAPRAYSLTRTMSTPLKFFGTKLVCHDAGEVMGIRYFFSLYNSTEPEHVGEDGFYLSITGILKTPTLKDGTKMIARKTIGMNFVVPCALLGLDHFVKDGLEWFTAEERCHPKNKQMLRTLLEAEATTFIEMVNAKKDEILAGLEAATLGG